MVRFEPLEPDASPAADEDYMIVTELAPGTFEISATLQKGPTSGTFKNTGALEYPLDAVKRIAAVRAEDAGVSLVYCKLAKDHVA